MKILWFLAGVVLLEIALGLGLLGFERAAGMYAVAEVEREVVMLRAERDACRSVTKWRR